MISHMVFDYKRTSSSGARTGRPLGNLTRIAVIDILRPPARSLYSLIVSDKAIDEYLGPIVPSADPGSSVTLAALWPREVALSAKCKHTANSLYVWSMSNAD